MPVDSRDWNSRIERSPICIWCSRGPDQTLFEEQRQRVVQQGRQRCRFVLKGREQVCQELVSINTPLLNDMAENEGPTRVHYVRYATIALETGGLIAEKFKAHVVGTIEHVRNLRQCRIMHAGN